MWSSVIGVTDLEQWSCVYVLAEVELVREGDGSENTVFRLEVELVQ